MKKEKRELTEKEIKDLEANYRGECSGGCGEELNSYNLSNDGITCIDCYEKDNS